MASSKLTRRKLGSILASVGAATQLGSAQAPARPEAEPDLENARQQARSNAEAIGRVKLPMATEPAFHFKA